MQKNYGINIFDYEGHNLFFHLFIQTIRQFSISIFWCRELQRKSICNLHICILRQFPRLSWKTSFTNFFSQAKTFLRISLANTTFDGSCKRLLLLKNKQNKKVSFLQLTEKRRQKMTLHFFYSSF